MKVKFSNDKSYPIEIDNTYETFHIHRFDLEDDESWEDFINQLNQYREGYLNNIVEQIAKNQKKF